MIMLYDKVNIITLSYILGLHWQLKAFNNFIIMNFNKNNLP